MCCSVFIRWLQNTASHTVEEADACEGVPLLDPNVLSVLLETLQLPTKGKACLAETISVLPSRNNHLIAMSNLAQETPKPLRTSST